MGERGPWEAQFESQVFKSVPYQRARDELAAPRILAKPMNLVDPLLNIQVREAQATETTGTMNHIPFQGTDYV